MADGTAKKKCFVVSPIGSPGSEVRVAADFFRHEIVEAALPDFKVKRADDFSKIDQITNQIIQAIVEAEIIVADLTGPNANVFYELGVAHSYKKHVIPMITDGQSIPFDNLAVRTISYSLTTYQSKQAARSALSSAVATTLAEEVSNPVTQALGASRLAASGDPKELVIAELSEGMAALRAEVRELREGREDRIPIVNALANLKVSDSNISEVAMIRSLLKALYGPALNNLTPSQTNIAIANTMRLISSRERDIRRLLSAPEKLDLIKQTYGDDIESITTILHR